VKKPQRLKPMESKQKVAFWVGISMAVVMIIVGWGITLREIIKKEAPLIRDQIDIVLDDVVEEFVKFSSETQEGSNYTKHDIKFLFRAYQASLNGEPLDEEFIEELSQMTSATEE
jgi:hypothetical protein